MTEQAIGFIGLGQMGRGMAQSILKADGALGVYDLSTAAIAQLASLGAVAYDSPRALAAQCNTIVLCVPSSIHVDEIIFGINGIAAANKTVTVLDASTLDRNDAIDFAQRTADQQITYCDCPVSGLPQRAQSGTLTVMFGGSDKSFAVANPVLKCFGDQVVHCGDVGSGQAMKSVNNIIYNINIAALCEVLPTAIAVGLDPEQVASIVTSGSARSFAAEHFIPKMLAGVFENDYSLQGAYKDIQNMQGMAQQANASMPVSNAMISRYEAAMAAGFQDEPKSAMLKLYEQAVGMQFRTRDTGEPNDASEPNPDQ